LHIKDFVYKPLWDWGIIKSMTMYDSIKKLCKSCMLHFYISKLKGLDRT